MLKQITQSNFLFKHDSRCKIREIFVLNIFLTFIYYSITLSVKHYSTDFFYTYFTSSAQQHLRLGRVFHYIIYSLFELLGIQIERHTIFNQLFLLFIISLLTTLLWNLFANIISIENTRDAIILDAIICLNFFNISILEGWFIFSETCFGGAMSLTISYCAIISFCQATNYRGYIKSLLFLIIALGMYQVYIEIFLIISATYILLKNQCILKKSTCYEFSMIIIIGGVASVISIIITKVLEILKISQGNERTIVINSNLLLHNATEIINNMQRVFDDYNGYLLKHSVFFFVVISLILLILNWLKKKDILLRYLTLIIFIIAILIAAYLPHFVVSNLWLAPRSILGVSSVIFAISIITFSNIKQHNIPVYILTMSLFAFLFVNYIQTQRIIVDGSILAGIEEENVHHLGEKIKNYEQATGIEVRYIAYAHDTSYKWTFDPITYNIFETNLRRANVDWAFVNMINFYLGTSFQRKELDEQQYSKIFGNTNWNYLDLDEQLYFKDDTVYIAVY